jgi:enoyl-CoA hydratase/carnithine racemase
MNEVSLPAVPPHDSSQRDCIPLTLQLTFGSPLPNSFGPFLSLRIPHPPHLRDTLLARRWKQSEAVEIGLLDEVVDDTGEGKEGAVVKRAMEIARREAPKVGAGSWGAIKVSSKEFLSHPSEL